MAVKKECEVFLDAVVNNVQLKKFVYKHVWISGSSTEVYPYALWANNHPRVEVQLDIKFKGKYPNYKLYAKDEREITAIAESLKKNNPIVKDFYLKVNDGSCPSELIFELNKNN